MAFDHTGKFYPNPVNTFARPRKSTTAEVKERQQLEPWQELLSDQEKDLRSLEHQRRFSEPPSLDEYRKVYRQALSLRNDPFLPRQLQSRAQRHLDEAITALDIAEGVGR